MRTLSGPASAFLTSGNGNTPRKAPVIASTLGAIATGNVRHPRGHAHLDFVLGCFPISRSHFIRRDRSDAAHNPPGERLQLD